MLPDTIRTVKDLILWEYAKLMAGLALSDHKKDGFISVNFNLLRSGEKEWFDILRKNVVMDSHKCAYCESAQTLSKDRIIPKRECHFAEIHNVVKTCKKCKASKGTKDLIEWWGLEGRFEPPKIVMEKYLKMLYMCHRCRGTLDTEDIYNNGDFDLPHISAVFQEPCYPEKVKR